MMADTKTMNMIEAINSALDIMLERDPDVVLMGEDIGYFGGVYRATAGIPDAGAPDHKADPRRLVHELQVHQIELIHLV